MDLYINCLTAGSTTIGWNTVKPHRWPLVRSAHAVFQRLHSTPDHVDDALEPPAPLSYKKCLLDYVESGPPDGMLFWDIYATWHLVEALYPHPLCTRPAMTVSALMQWADLILPNDGLRQDAEFILQQVLPQLHPTFWLLIKRLVFRGRYQDAMKIIQYSMSFAEHVDGFDLLAVLLGRAPQIELFSDKTQFLSRWKVWQSECQSTLERIELQSLAPVPLLEVVRIMCGDEQAIRNVSDKWQEVLIAFLLHRKPAAEPYEVKQVLAAFRDILPRETSSHIEQLQLALIEMDTYLSVRLAEGIDKFLGSHLTDYIHLCNQLEQDDDISTEMDLREFTLLSYAESLMGIDELWEVAADYLSTCPRFGQAFLSILVTRTKFKSGDYEKFGKLIEVCEENEFVWEAKRLHRIMARKMFEEKQFGSAIEHSLIAEDSRKIDNIVNSVLERYALDPQCQTKLSEILSTIGEPAVISQNTTLTFLDIYSRFLGLVKSENESKLQESISLLIDLASTNLTPDGVIGNILLESLILLENRRCVMNSDETLEILRLVEDVSQSHKKLAFFHTLLAGKRWTMEQKEHWVDEQIRVLRFACSRNLARSMLIE